MRVKNKKVGGEKEKEEEKKKKKIWKSKTFVLELKMGPFHDAKKDQWLTGKNNMKTKKTKNIASMQRA